MKTIRDSGSVLVIAGRFRKSSCDKLSHPGLCHTGLLLIWPKGWVTLILENKSVSHGWKFFPHALVPERPGSQPP